MTAPAGAILFNSSTGSDSLASGLGPATAVNSTNQSTTASYSGTTITFSGATDLSGVTAGHLLYLVTSTGRKFFVIASVNDGADSLTVDDTPTGTASGLSWAIGGKRATLSNADSLALFSVTNAKTDWTVEIEETGTPYTITEDVEVGASMTIQGSTGHVEVRQSSNDWNFSVTSDAIPTIRRIKCTNTNGTKTSSAGLYKSNGQNGGWRVKDCILGDPTNTLGYGCWLLSSGANRALHLVDTEIQYCTISGVTSVGNNVSYRSCYVHHNAVGHSYATGNNSMDVKGSIFAFNTGNGLTINTSGAVQVENSVLHGNGGHGIGFTSAGFIALYQNVLTENGGYAISGGADTALARMAINYNASYANTSGVYSVYAAGDSDITLTADPYVDAAAGDFNLNTTADGGQTLRDTTRTIAT